MLSTIVEHHIALHHATGYRFKKSASLLRNFARYAEAKGDEVVRAATALAWAAQAPTPGARYCRLQAVCRFAKLMQLRTRAMRSRPGRPLVIQRFGVPPTSSRRRRFEDS